MPKCKGCGATIRFRRTPKGKYLPVDAESRHVQTEGIPESLAHQIETFVTPGGEIIKGLVVTEESSDLEASVPHWATCPKAEQFRKR